MQILHFIIDEPAFLCYNFKVVENFEECVKMNLEQPPEKKTCRSHNETSIMRENEIGIQNKKFFGIRCRLKVNTKKEDRIVILKFNKQYSFERISEIKKSVFGTVFFITSLLKMVSF